MEYYNQNKSKGFEIVSVNVQYPNETAEESLDFKKEFEAKFTIALNRTPSDVARAYKVDATPINVVIDRNGNIVTRVRGGGEENLDKIERAIVKAGLNNPPDQ